MRLLDGKIIAREIKDEVKQAAETYCQQGIVPTLGIILATDDGGVRWYVNSIKKAAEACAVDIRVVELSSESSTEQIAEAINALATDETVHGIILQTPLPVGVNTDDLLELIPVAKDIDGANPLSAGRLLYGMPAFAPATAEAVMKVCEYYDIPLAGRHATVIGRSRVVGKPVAHLLLQQDATVTLCHSRTGDIAEHTRMADIVVAAAGKIGLVTADMIRPGAIVIDVGTNPTPDGKLVGDVAIEVHNVADALTPVPGGIGVVTTALILQHTLLSVKRRFS